MEAEEEGGEEEEKTVEEKGEEEQADEEPEAKEEGVAQEAEVEENGEGDAGVEEGTAGEGEGEGEEEMEMPDELGEEFRTIDETSQDEDGQGEVVFLFERFFCLFRCAVCNLLVLSGF